MSGISRYRRATELRVSEVGFCDTESRALWNQIVNKKVNLIPVRTASAEARHQKREEISKYYKIDGPFAFLHVFLLDNRSEFMAPLKVERKSEGEDYIVKVSGAIAIANTIAYISELIDPIAMFPGIDTPQSRDTVTRSFCCWGRRDRIVGLSDPTSVLGVYARR